MSFLIVATTEKSPEEFATYDITLGNNVSILNNSMIGYGTVCDDQAIIDIECIIGKLVTIGKNTRILAQTIVKTSTYIGDDCLIHQNVIIGEYTTIENNVIIGEGCIIGHYVKIESGVILSEGIIVPQHYHLFAGIYLDQESIIQESRRIDLTPPLQSSEIIDIANGMSMSDEILFDDMSLDMISRTE